jgi:hypothetical protein
MKTSTCYKCFAIVLISSLLTGCEKEKTAEDQLPGKWQIEFLHIISYVDNVFLGDSTAYYASNDAWIEFKGDKTGHVYVKNYEDYNFTWSLNGDFINFIVPLQDTIYLNFAVSESSLAYFSEMNKGPWLKNPSKTYKEEWYIWAIKLTS